MANANTVTLKIFRTILGNIKSIQGMKYDNK